MAVSIYQSGIVQVKSYRIIQATVTSVIKTHGLGSVSEWFMLAYIHEHTDTTARDLAALLNVEAPLATLRVGELHDAGLVKITAHPTDGRIKLINTQPRAKKLIASIEDDVQKRLGILLKGISQEELRTYNHVLGTIIENGSTHEKDLR